MEAIKLEDTLRQIQGPCVDRLFTVKEIDGNLVRVVPRNNPKAQPEWCHIGNFIKVTNLKKDSP